jgi:hypothetical protein
LFSNVLLNGQKSHVNSQTAHWGILLRCFFLLKVFQTKMNETKMKFFVLLHVCRNFSLDYALLNSFILSVYLSVLQCPYFSPFLNLQSPIVLSPLLWNRTRIMALSLGFFHYTVFQLLKTSTISTCKIRRKSHRRRLLSKNSLFH